MRSAILLALLAGTAAADVPRVAIPQYSIWQGTYTCAQGITAVKLTVEARANGGAATGHFEFGPLDANPNLPKGDYWLKGTARPTKRGELEVALVPDKWAAHPEGWVMVGVTARSDREQRTMLGTIDYTSCTTIAVVRLMPEAN